MANPDRTPKRFRPKRPHRINGGHLGQHGESKHHPVCSECGSELEGWLMSRTASHDALCSHCAEHPICCVCGGTRVFDGRNCTYCATGGRNYG